MRILHTERLTLRPFVLEDAEALHREIYSDEQVLRWYSGTGVLTLDQTRQRLADHLCVWAEEELGRHAVVRTDDDALLGQVHLTPYVNRSMRWRAEPDPPFNAVEVELAFAFGRTHWGHGYAYEACRAMLDYAFGHLRLPRLVGEFHERNDRSRRLHERLGYRIERNLMPGQSGFVAVLDNPQGPIDLLGVDAVPPSSG